MKRIPLLALVIILFVTPPATAQLASAWVVPAAANADGVQQTSWHTDLSLHNPHEYWLPVVVQFLPSGTVNYQALAIDLEIAPWETVNLWDVLGPEAFDTYGTGALLLYAGFDADCSEPSSCDFLTTSRTYTPDGYDGEFGQAISGLTVDQGTDWWTYGYVAGILNDDWDFRCNAGAMSWSDDWVRMAVDVQDAAGNILNTETFDIPPFGHLQHRLQTVVTGGSLVFYLVDGPDDALVFPYASVVNQVTGDPSFFAAMASEVGPVLPKAERAATGPRPRPEISRWVSWERDAESAR